MQYNTPQDVIDYINRLEDRLEKLERLGRGGSTSIDKGALVIKKNNDPTKVVAAFGDLNSAGLGVSLNRPDGSAQMGVVIKRDTGELAFALWDDSPLAGYQQYFAMFDRGGRIVLGDDTDSGWGLAAPYISGSGWMSLDITQWPVTTSGTFVGALQTDYVVQNPKLYTDFLMYTDANTVGEFQLLIGGVQYGTTVQGGNASGAAVYTSFQQILTLPQTMHKTIQLLQINYRRVSGTGNVRCSARGLHGIQT